MLSMFQFWSEASYQNNRYFPTQIWHNHSTFSCFIYLKNHGAWCICVSLLSYVCISPCPCPIPNPWNLVRIGFLWWGSWSWWSSNHTESPQTPKQTSVPKCLIYLLNTETSHPLQRMWVVPKGNSCKTTRPLANTPLTKNNSSVLCLFQLLQGSAMTPIWLGALYSNQGRFNLMGIYGPPQKPMGFRSAWS